ncbi:MAG: hypothetical protein R3E44_14265 [Paracoccaceae bacterium]
MPPARFVPILLAVLAAAGLTVWVASLAGLQAGTGGGALWVLIPLLAATLAILFARRR